ncbi:hypothetical protein PHJA_000015700 [Phtheirospermum japonicum]|uniref:Uncharacterized protein n=1 Tax=Phtheirospermum japonicum TaxID=374723 RepID=A0A830B9Q1_9LAMI|nr:hypothetical protein PHJA_000015700 [Phtheirospermum japonicum]
MEVRPESAGAGEFGQREGELGQLEEKGAILLCKRGKTGSDVHREEETGADRVTGLPSGLECWAGMMGFLLVDDGQNNNLDIGLRK